MEKLVFFVAYFGICFLSTCIVNGQIEGLSFSTMQNQKAIQNRLLKGYKKTIRPIFDQDLPVSVGIQFLFRKMHHYNVVSGLFEFTGGIRLSWKDASLTWNPKDYGNASATRLPVDEVWIPNIGVRNPAKSEEFMEIGIKGFSVEVTSKGVVHLRNSGLIKMMCQSDVTYYPFDTHTCSLVLIILNYNSNEVKFHTKKQVEESSDFKDNGQWKVTVLGSRISAAAMSVDLKIGRRPSFLVVNIFLPVIFILTINIVVFLLPVESGERVSFSITGFLAFTVFITILTDQVPHQSNPLSILSSLFAFQLANSTMVLMCNVLVVNLYHRATNITSSCLLAFVRLTRRNTRRKTSVLKIGTNIQPNSDYCEPNDDNSFDNGVTWKDVASVFDKCFLFVFLCSTFVPIFVFILYVRHHF